jgi:hypothetical protein
MIPKSGYRLSEKIMLKQQAKAKYRINLKSFRFSDEAIQGGISDWIASLALAMTSRSRGAA